MLQLDCRGVVHAERAAHRPQSQVAGVRQRVGLQRVRLLLADGQCLGHDGLVCGLGCMDVENEVAAGSSHGIVEPDGKLELHGGGG